MIEKVNLPIAARMRRLVMSDSHGSYKGIVQCLERSRFNPDQDQLIFLGDVVDGWSETKESIELLMQFKNLVYLLGNHDEWAIQFYQGELIHELRSWLRHGGEATMNSYGIGEPMPQEHLAFLLDAKPYYVTDDHKLFVHAGFNPALDITQTGTRELIWSRDFINRCHIQYKISPAFTVAPFDQIYVGHTPTTDLLESQTLPFCMGNVTMMDTGAAFQRCLSIMDVDTKQVWQSDRSKFLYPKERGRNPYTWEEEKALYNL
jgi:serine/threonine protein phosphatase 1